MDVPRHDGAEHLVVFVYRYWRSRLMHTPQQDLGAMEIGYLYQQEGVRYIYRLLQSRRGHLHPSTSPTCHLEAKAFWC